MPLTFRARHRLSHEREFAAVYGARLRAQRGGIVVHLRANDRPEPRLGLSVGRRVGSAVVRNRFKRLLREAFRSIRRDVPLWSGGSYDVVVSVHPHAEAPLAEYREAMLALTRELARRDARRRGEA